VLLQTSFAPWKWHLLQHLALSSAHHSRQNYTTDEITQQNSWSTKHSSRLIIESRPGRNMVMLNHNTLSSSVLQGSSSSLLMRPPLSKDVLEDFFQCSFASLLVIPQLWYSTAATRVVLVKFKKRLRYQSIHLFTILFLQSMKLLIILRDKFLHQTTHDKITILLPP
jgi:hypothetical protein